ncbi:bifunctional glutamate N-acetyltransferase/amino-acid acetyltransferase ArgJ [Thermicanus aegyptius]|uniref:bifunctional glutamate N-acetyltransferase/amino-acid acetyltransferase ArgJ n=1 Tax=Thermicanus aegyptius TaxID=94009 RepID=UPI000587A032|nr:bifunctional glutamate N-acetyltransferase/amino-acid acetyltransferase ArgJ [Thermicanus aegyptius]
MLEKEGGVKVFEGGITSPQGFHAGGIHIGLKKKRLDLGWIYSEIPANSAAVYTVNLFQAAPLLVTKESIGKEGCLQAVLVNSGNANACTGEEGLRDAYEMRDSFAEFLHLPPHRVAVSSTGVIGEPLPMEKIRNGIRQISRIIKEGDATDFEQAILTTDTTRKRFSVEVAIDGKKVVIGGAAKGSGMIHPNMATMLAFLTTDAAVEQQALQLALRQVTDETFNMITVDGDMSTNDMVLIMANGLAANRPLHPEHPEWSLFLAALKEVAKNLAKQIARDGEGATKLIEVHVTGASDEETAKAVGKAIVGSSLVKTAVYGADANWGRIIAAIGYSRSPIDPNLVSIRLGSLTLFQNGKKAVYSEEEATEELKKETVRIEVLLGGGKGEATAWGCDLTYDYVRINASYRT